MFKKIITIIFVAIVLKNNLSSQIINKISTNYTNIYQFNKNKKPRNSSTAFWLSAIVPGAGQIYNGKFWKLPFIYGAGYYTFTHYQKNNTEYKMYFHDHLILDDTNSTEPLYMGINDKNILYQKMSEVDRKRSLFFLGIILVWTLNAVDAYVDAELSNFDVSDNLALNIHPKIDYLNNKPFAAICVKLYLK